MKKYLMTVMFKSGVTKKIRFHSDNQDGINEILSTIDTSMKEGVNAVLRIGHQKIRCSEVCYFNLEERKWW